MQALHKLASQLQALPAWQRLIPQLTAGLAHPAPRVQAVVRALLRNLNATHPNELVFSLLAGSMDGTGCACVCCLAPAWVSSVR